MYTHTYTCMRVYMYSPEHSLRSERYSLKNVKILQLKKFITVTSNLCISLLRSLVIKSFI